MSQLENLNFKDSENTKNNSLSLLWLLLGFFVLGFLFWLGSGGPANYEKKLEEKKTETIII